jgi:hypothetical protein
MESGETDTEMRDSTTIEMDADYYEREKSVADDGRLWLGDDWAGGEVEIALRKKSE